jgi:hypothetical protein
MTDKINARTKSASVKCSFKNEKKEILCKESMT